MPFCRWDKPADFGGADAGGAGADSGWTEVKDEGSGKSYYYNTQTGVTQWDPPPGFAAAAASGGAVAAGGATEAAVRSNTLQCAAAPGRATSHRHHPCVS